jgi:hypothetical protein
MFLRYGPAPDCRFPAKLTDERMDEQCPMAKKLLQWASSMAVECRLDGGGFQFPFFGNFPLE